MSFPTYFPYHLVAAVVSWQHNWRTTPGSDPKKDKGGDKELSVISAAKSRLLSRSQSYDVTDRDATRKSKSCSAEETLQVGDMERTLTFELQERTEYPHTSRKIGSIGIKETRSDKFTSEKRPKGILSPMQILRNLENN
jgi:hypothetical protein